MKRTIKKKLRLSAQVIRSLGEINGAARRLSDTECPWSAIAPCPTFDFTCQSNIPNGCATFTIETCAPPCVQ